MSDPRLVVVCGLPGTGKTTVARAVADRLDATRLRTDVVRKELVADPEYTSDEERRVYDELVSRAGDRLADGEPVVLDGTFYRARHRDRAAALAADRGVPFDLLRVECPPSVVERRMAGREDDASDADFGVHLQYREQFEPVERDHATIDNAGGLDALREQVAERF